MKTDTAMDLGLSRGTYAQRQQATLGQMARLTLETSGGLAEARAARDRALREAEAAFEASTGEETERRDHARSAVKRDVKKYTAEAEAEFTEANEEATRKHNVNSGAAVEAHEKALRRAKERFEEKQWLAETMLDSSLARAKQGRDRVGSDVDGRRRELDSLRDQAVRTAGPAGRKMPPVEAERAGDAAAMDQTREAAVRAVARLRRSPVIGMLRSSVPLMLVLALPLIGAAAGAVLSSVNPEAVRGLALGPAAGVGAGAGLLAALALGLPLQIGGGAVAKKRLIAASEALSAAHAALNARLADADAAREAEEREAHKRHAAELEAAQTGNKKRMEEIAQREGAIVQQHESAFKEATAKAQRRRAYAVERLSERAERRLLEIEENWERATTDARAAYDAAVAETERCFEETRHRLERAWFDGGHASTASLQSLAELSSRFWLPWTDRAFGDEFRPAMDAAPAVPFGALRFDGSAHVPSPEAAAELDERLRRSVCTDAVVPAVVDFPGSATSSGGGVLFETGPRGRERALASARNLMLRLLTGLPPGKARFTIIDPVGLGQSFAGFMTLADYEELLVSSRIWTEDRHIEQRLTDLTEHMENVIQKYLRDEFATIEAYNEHAGEIAEPYRFLIIADYPSGFTENAGRRLRSILESGARCGVYVIMVADPKPKTPAALPFDTIREHATVVRHDETEDRFRLVGRGGTGKPTPRGGLDENDAADGAGERRGLGALRLDLDPPPTEDRFRTLIRLIGEASRDANKVEVPFKLLAPPGLKETHDEGLWTRSTAGELRVPLGRAGATKLQDIALGKGTSQHALVAGKTGSGKSTLLNVLIANGVLWHSPDELEFYLVDFKKGVEFKAYAAEELPHIRAVAIESEREFGLSVLQRLDDELRMRGDLFRSANVQNLANWREARPEHPMPRTVLVIDEFQELFVEDDKIGQEAALLLDRLVRQGRAFGIHCVLGSQTLSGAYSLARSTMGQMGVRVALQCSETDSYLIMSEDNAAARLLTRPGEAIYNDAGGLLEGNSPFQVAWLSDAERDAALRRASGLARQRGVPTGDQIVFEGNADADLSRNRGLLRLASGEDEPAVAPVAYIGEPVAIRPAVSVRLRRQIASNILVVGQRDAQATGIIASAMTSLAVHARARSRAGAGGARFVVIDGTPEDDVLFGALPGVAERLRELGLADFEIGSWRDAGRLLADVAAEVKRRDAQAVTDAPPVYLVLHALHRLRDLRKGESDFSFSFSAPESEEEDSDGAKSLSAVLKDGSGFGVHTLAWCDSVQSLGRTLERGDTRAFEHRVLFQMSPGDSTSLIESAAASKLGVHRALYQSEESNEPEKLRPYAVPGDDALRKLAEAIRSQ